MSTASSKSDSNLKPDSSKFKDFLKNLESFETKPAILTLIEPYASSYIPKSLHPALPIVLSGLYKADLLKMDIAQLLELSQEKIETCYNIIGGQCVAVEENTRKQCNSRIWFRMRTGRVTASRLKAVCHTSIEKPSVSLIHSICYPALSKFKNAATSWGCDHESVARGMYTHYQASKHECGFFIHRNYGFIGASPDGLTVCCCCGEGVCEIKVRTMLFLTSFATCKHLIFLSPK